MALVFNTTIIPLDELPSPYILLPPHQVHDIVLSTYIHLGTFSIFIWDVLNNLRSDWRVGPSFKQVFVTSVYFTTRITLLAYTIGRAVLITHTVKNCAAFQDALNSFLVVFVASTTFLFYARVCTLYLMNKAIVGFFGVLWLAVVGTAGTYCKTFTAGHINVTLYCMENPAGDLLGPTLAIQLVNEILLYIAIARRVYRKLLSESQQSANSQSWGIRLATIRRFVLLDPHLYCVAIVASKAFLVCAVYAFNPPVNSMFYVVHLVLTNVWCGRMYRGIKQSALPALLSQTEFELRLGARTRPMPSVLNGDQDLVRTQDQSAADKNVANVNEDIERTSTITYHVRKDIKT